MVMRNKRAVIVFALIYAVLPLALGVAIYALFRQPVSILTQLFGIREQVIDVSFLPDLVEIFLKYHLPDMLFAFAFAGALRLVFESTAGVCIFVCFYVAFFETLQFFSVIPGTGDLWDVVFSILAVTVFAALSGRGKKQPAVTKKNRLCKVKMKE